MPKSFCGVGRRLFPRREIGVRAAGDERDLVVRGAGHGRDERRARDRRGRCNRQADARMRVSCLGSSLGDDPPPLLPAHRWAMVSENAYRVQYAFVPVSLRERLFGRRRVRSAGSIPARTRGVAKQSERFKVVPKEKRSTTRFLARMVPGATAGADRGVPRTLRAGGRKGSAARQGLGPRNPVRRASDRGASGAEPPCALRR